MMRLLVAALLVLSLAGASWAGMRGNARAPGLSSNLSTTRHGYPSGLGP